MIIDRIGFFSGIYVIVLCYVALRQIYISRKTYGSVTGGNWLGMLPRIAAAAFFFVWLVLKALRLL